MGELSGVGARSRQPEKTGMRSLTQTAALVLQSRGRWSEHGRALGTSGFDNRLLFIVDKLMCNSWKWGKIKCEIIVGIF